MGKTSVKETGIAHAVNTEMDVSIIMFADY